jgi:hypothetical protein
MQPFRRYFLSMLWFAFFLVLSFPAPPTDSRLTVLRIVDALGFASFHERCLTS